ncbi:hypothetical protein HKD42_10525 [Altererythrobacter sp. RZ02]|uniref:Uncharacterized protein n=1 Tax=Pontixanthobacter rizhaonensis TaxID=2730337 RepID=A0A848QSM8_9SPHN|nr:hypothetical protein [Pontixanthobacter rizhaonensis]NMW32496.1 hypothetical protein [Pontixanthobacter rizhaonensis]
MAKIQTALRNPALASLKNARLESDRLENTLMESARAGIVIGCAAALALAGTTLPF